MSPVHYDPGNYIERTRFSQPRSVVVIGYSMTRVVTASKYPADTTITTWR